MKQHGSLAVDVLQAAVEHCVKRAGAGMIRETCSVQSFPFHFLLPASKMCAHLGSSACRCLLGNALPRVKVWRTSTKQNGYLKDFVDSSFSCIEKLYIQRKII